MQKSVAFLFADNQKEIFKFPIYSCIKRIKYLGIYLTKVVKDLYLGNCKTQMKYVDDGTNKWKFIPF